MLGRSPLLFAPTPFLLVQYSTRHMGVVKKVGDPEGRGRVQVEVPGLLGTGKENWTDWIEVLGTRIGGTKGQGDEGNWDPLQPGQIVLVEFISGNPFALACTPGPPVQEDKGQDKQWVPKEAKIIAKGNKRDATRLRIIKTEAGDTLLFDGRGKKEKMALVNWAGAGLFCVAPGKEADEEEKEGEESKPRKGKRRGTKLVVNGDTGKPSELLRTGTYLWALLDLIAQGIIGYCVDDGGKLALYSKKKDGAVGPSILVDSEEDAVFITAGACQWQILGKENKIAVTRQIIQEIPEKADVESVIVKMLEAIGKEFEELREA